MAEYPKPSLLFQREVVNASLTCMQMIGKLDRAQERLSRRLDKKLEAIRGKKLENEHDIEEINQMRRAIEIVAAKKVELAMKNYDFLDLNIKTIDGELTMLEKAIKDSGNPVPYDAATHSVTSSSSSEAHGKTKDSQNSKKSSSTIDEGMHVANEPVYCICKRVAFGDMIACDNEDCPVEWFHYPCVNLSRKPKNSWICPLCSTKRKR